MEALAARLSTYHAAVERRVSAYEEAMIERWRILARPEAPLYEMSRLKGGNP